MEQIRERVLIIDDDRDFVDQMIDLLGEDFDVHGALSAVSGLQKLMSHPFDAVVLDHQLGGDYSGLDVLEKIREKFRYLPVVMVSKYFDTNVVSEAIRRGAECVPKTEQGILGQLIRNAIDRNLRDRRVELHDRERKGESFDPVFASEQMLALRDELLQIKDADVTLLITGPTGVGKDVLCRWVHESSVRAAKPYVVVELPSLTPTLIESELFGYEKGAFNEAKRRTDGRLQLAQGGTVVLNEIGDLPYPLQAKLLRAIEEKKITRVGGREDIHIDVRFVALTNRDLEDDVRKGTFREDLFYRLCGFHTDVPSLCQRREEIIPLAEHFLGRFGQGHVKSLDPELQTWFRMHHWPGNVRELRDDVRRGITRARDTILTIEDVFGKHLEPRHPEARPGGVAANGAAFSRFPLTIEDAKVEMMRIYLDELLRFTSGNVTEAARYAGVERQYLYRLFKRFKMAPETYRSR